MEFVTCLGCGCGRSLPRGAHLPADAHGAICPTRAGFEFVCSCEGQYCCDNCDGDWWAASPPWTGDIALALLPWAECGDELRVCLVAARQNPQDKVIQDALFGILEATVNPPPNLSE